MRSNKHLRDFLESSFRPLHCAVELHDYDKNIRFRVLGSNGEPLVRFAPIPLAQLRDGPGLETIVGAVRRRLEFRGHKLLPANRADA